MEQTEGKGGRQRVRNLRRRRGPWQVGSGTISSLVPLLIFSLMAAAFMTQSDAILAHSFFQSPVSPVQTPRPAATPTEVEPGPPDESPVVPPAESPVVPPGETPAVPPTESPVVPPGETPVVPPEESPEVLPGETPGATTGPRVTPSAGGPEEVATAEPPSGEEGPAPASEDSLAVLIDALVVGLSSLWLCCGGLALVIFFLLVVASFLLRVT